MLIDFTGKTAVVTGGANRIGLSIARRLAESGGKVWILDLDTERPEETARAIGASGLVADVTSRVSLEEAFGRAPVPDIVVANAGMGVNRTLVDTDRKSTRLNSSHIQKSRMPSSA